MTTLFYTHLATDNFERAYRKAYWRDWLKRLVGKHNNLLSFDDIPVELRRQAPNNLGLQAVPLNQIVGSEGRYHEFDQAFYPREKRSKDRWVRVDQAHLANVLLPPVELLKIGESYFVRDGNHRVSVARAHGQAHIDATVIEIGRSQQSDSARVS